MISQYINVFVKLIFFAFISQCYCERIELKLGTKTPYRFVANTDVNIKKYEGCEPTKIWMMVRHGTRNPSAKIMLNMKNILPKLRDEILENHHSNRGQLTSDEVSKLKSWTPIQDDIADEKKLTHEGEDEMILLGERMKKRYPQIITKDIKTALFRYTPTQRAELSAKSFAKGIFGNESLSEDLTMLKSEATNDPILRFYKKCESWHKGVKKNPKTYAEVKKFVNGMEMLNALKKMTGKIGRVDVIPYETGKLIYQTCGLETAWYKNIISPWCAFFDSSSMAPFEYAEDLKYYWLDGYGYEITQNLACMVSKNINDFFRNSSSPLLSAFHFTHSGTLLKTIVHFGLHQTESPLMHDTSNLNRTWRSSLIDAFGSNLAFVLHRCHYNTNKILILHQEKIMSFPNCNQEDELCPLDTFFEIKRQSIENCDVGQMCRIGGQKDEL